MKKQFKTLAVVGAYSGRLLEHGCFGDIHDVFDHLYPGIMTLGVAAMADNASRELLIQEPRLMMFDEVAFQKLGIDQFKHSALCVLGESIEVDCPVHVSKTDIKSAFDAMAERVNSNRA